MTAESQPAKSERTWFVYYEIEYYPWAELVTAETPEDAVKHLSAYHREKGSCAVVLPADCMTIVGETEADKNRCREGLIFEGEQS